MSETTITQLPDPSIADRRLRSNLPKGGFSADPFTEVIRDGARKLIEQAIHAELATLMAAFSKEKLKDGRARLVRHGDLPPEAPSFITRVCGFGFHILHRQFGQARRARSPQVAQALGVLQLAFCSRVMSAV
jgi:hypothetical protein